MSRYRREHLKSLLNGLTFSWEACRTISIYGLKQAERKDGIMVDFSKKRKKSTRIIAGVICLLLVAGMVIGLLVGF